MAAKQGDYVLNLRVVVSGLGEHQSPCDHVNDILQELTSRKDFRSGLLPRGVFLKHVHDHTRLITTVEVDSARLADITTPTAY